MGMFGTFGGGSPSGNSPGNPHGNPHGNPGMNPAGFGGAHPAERLLSDLASGVGRINEDVFLSFMLLADARKRMARLEARAALADAGRSPRYPIEFRSQFGEDALMWTLLDGQLEGFFIEVGAFDGYSLSTTYGFEAVGWNGLLVEAIPARHAACAERRRHSRVVNAALGKKGASGTTSFTVVDDQYGGVLSYNTTDDRHLEFVRKSQFLRSTVTVPLTSMDAVLEPIAPKVIDFATIDVEGGEPDLIDGFDLARWKPRILLIEDNSRGTSAQGRELGQRLTRAGYTHFGWLIVNGLYIHRDDKALTERARALLRP